MSFSLPGRAAGRSVSKPAADPPRYRADAELAHREQVAELQQIISKQAKRIEELKLNTAVQLEHHSTLRRLELERRKMAAQDQISKLMPRLENVRSQWNHAKRDNQGFEMQWGSLRAQYQQMRQKVDALKDQILDGNRNIEDLRTLLSEMREKLHSLDRERTMLRGKIKRALECLVIDDSLLKTRLLEEEEYYNRLQQAMAAMEAEYQESQSQYRHELSPLEEDVRVLSLYLEEMQVRTKELERYCLDLEAKGATAEEHWIESAHSVFEAVERANNLDRMKNAIVRFLEQQIQDHREAGVEPRGRGGELDTFWLSNAVAVWEGIVREVGQERQKLQVREDDLQLIAETTQKTQLAKAQLAEIKSRVYGTGMQRRHLFLDLCDLHFLQIEKKESEEELIKYVQEIATQLDEDLSHVLHTVRKEGYDDYVSSEEESAQQQPEGAREEFAPLAEEGNEDISLIVSSIDLDPDDPSSADILKRMAHRPEGPLREFAARRAQSLQKAATKGRTAAPRVGHSTPLFLEKALQDVQLKVTNEVIAFVKNRQQQIEQGLLDPKNEHLVADPKYVSRVREQISRVERWCTMQGDAANFSLRKQTGEGAHGTPHGGLTKIVIEGAKVPPEVARSNLVSQAMWYLTNAIRGVNFMMYVRTVMAPQLRLVFLSRDCTRLIARRVGSTGEDAMIRLSDVTNIKLGHLTDVFKELKIVTKHLMREELAFSIISNVGTTFDLECETADDRNYWANIFAWIVNESRPGGVVQRLTAGGKISVADTANRTLTPVEPSDRHSLQVKIAG